MLQSYPFQVLVSLVLAWILWRVVLQRFLVAPHPLDRIPGLKPSSWIGGSLLQLFDQDGWDFHDTMADKHGGVFKCQGFFGTRILYVHDPTALQHIALKEQHLVESSDDMVLMNKIVFGPGLLSSMGSDHRKQRKMMNPAFSTSQIRAMTPVFNDVARELCGSISRQTAGGSGTVDMMDKFTRAALECIARGVLGHSFDALKDGVDPPYLVSVKNFARIMTFPEFMFPRFFILPYVWQLGPTKLRRWILEMLPWKKLHILKDMVDIMHNTSVDLFQSRIDAVDRHEEQSDILSVLLKANLAAPDGERLCDAELLAQITTITFAAMGTTSSGLARILYLLCEHPHVQEQVRREIKDARILDEDIGYDTIMTLPVLDSVYKETFRVYTPLPLMMKQVVGDTVIPLSKSYPTTDGSTFKEIITPKGTYLVVSLNACNRDPAIWGKDARDWKPSRWMNPLPESVANAKVPGVYSHLMTFFGGQKSCIGYKFAELVTKVTLSVLLENFQFSFGDKEIVWKMNGLNQPMIENDDSVDEYGLPRLQMPLRVVSL